jgi:hypothetical protein
VNSLISFIFYKGTNQVPSSPSGLQWSLIASGSFGRILSLPRGGVLGVTEYSVCWSAEPDPNTGESSTPVQIGSLSITGPDIRKDINCIMGEVSFSA